MITDLLKTLTDAVQGSVPIALTASCVWGILSVVLSPCHLSSIPLIVGFVDQQGRISTKRAFVVSLLFSGGILLSIAIIGVITGLAGRVLGNLGPHANYFVAIVFFLVGLVLLDVIPMPFSKPGQLQVASERKGLLAALLLGLIFGIALGPCTFAFLAPMLGVTFKVASSRLAYGIALLTAYGIGHCSVIVVAGTSAQLVQRYLNWNEKSRGPIVVKRICGALVLLGGLYLIYAAP